MVKARYRQRIRLEERDLAILEHVFRYRMTVVDALVKLDFFDEKSPYAAKNVLRRLRNGGYLNSAPLFGTRRYYYLTPAAVHVIGQSEAIARPLPEQTKIDAFGILVYCCCRLPQQEKLTLAEFQNGFSNLFRRGERPNYYIDSTEEIRRLGFIRVDRGGFGRWDRLINRCRDDVAKRCDLPAFRALIDQGGFVFTLLTSLPQKAERIVEAVCDQGFPCEFRVEAIPEMLELVAPAPVLNSRRAAQGEIR